MCRLQKFWLPIICSLLFSVTTTGAAAASVQLYSALGESLLAEIPLLPEELGQDLSSFQVEGAGHSWSLLAIPEQSLLLLFSQQPVHDPIVELRLFAGERERLLTLFVDPVAPQSSKELFGRLFEAQRQQLTDQQQRITALQQAQQLKVEVAPWERGLRELQGSVFSGWLFFLLLGGIAALLILRWWRSAEVVDLNQGEGFSVEAQDSMRSEETIWEEFQHGVSEIESQIQSQPQPHLGREAGG